MSKPLLLYWCSAGRLANQLLNLAHLLAWIEENHRSVTLVNPAFWRYADLFVSTQFNALCYYPPALNPIPGKRLNRVLSKLLKQDRFRFVFPLNKLIDGFYDRSTLSLRYDSPFNLGNKEFDPYVMDRRITFVGGWVEETGCCFPNTNKLFAILRARTTVYAAGTSLYRHVARLVVRYVSWCADSTNRLSQLERRQVFLYRIAVRRSDEANS